MCFFLQCQRSTCVSNLLSILGETLRKPFVWGGSLLILHRNSGSWIYGKCGVNLEKHWRALTLQPEKNTNNGHSTIRTFVYFLPQHATDLYVSHSTQWRLSPPSNSVSFFIIQSHSVSPSHSFTYSLIYSHFLSLSVLAPTSSFFHLQSDSTSSMKCWPLNSGRWTTLHWLTLPSTLSSFLAQSCHVKWVAILGARLFCVSVCCFQQSQTSDLLFVLWQWKGAETAFKALLYTCSWGWRCVEKPPPSNNMKGKQIPYIFPRYVFSSGIQRGNLFTLLES